MDNRTLSTAPSTPARHVSIGRHGERIARTFLRQCGYRIMGQNVRVGRHDEIDVIAYDPQDDTLVFCEVKTRRNHHPDYDPELNMTHAKKIALVRSARAWVDEHRWEGGYRIDALFVAGNRVLRHVRQLAVQTPL